MTVDEARMSKGWRRLAAITCTLLLAGSLFLVLGVTVWAQEQPQPTEQPAETGQPAGTTQQPAQTGQTTQQQGLTIDYWEPQVGTRTVHYVEDINDIHGNIFGTSMLGYWDAALLYSTSISRINYASSFYRGVEAISNMNPVYFDLKGPWYFSMTTPFKYVEEVIGIHEAPEAAEFPQATYAVRYLIIGSGGNRVWGTVYRSCDAAEKKWLEWGMTMEYFPSGKERAVKETIHYRSPSDRKMAVPQVIMTFPLSVGTTGSIDAYYAAGGGINEVSGSGTFEVIAEGKITVPAGTFDALLIKGSITSPPSGKRFTQMEYAWFVKDLGVVADASSLANESDPLFETATDIAVIEEQTGPGAPGK
ncbi:MAG: hypothetical protein PHS26_03500 [Actinomycetota bacterium]|nr:hypothetical protein [Actinomycetota bacterium]